MKKPLKRILWITGILFGLIIIALAVFFINYIVATKAMTPSETGALNDSVWCIKDKFVNAFIFKGKKGYIMFDAGISKDNFRTELAKTGIATDKIKNILLTHTDGDHTASVPLFSNPTVYMHREEEQMVNGTTGKTKFVKTRWEYGPYKLLNSNDTLQIDGLKIKVFFTPGHTPGSCCYIINDVYLVSGDNLIVKNGKYEQFDEAFNMNTAQQLESVKLLPMPATFKYILTAHYGIVKN
jgi:hydroxyacylglutathione hydrolase